MLVASLLDVVGDQQHDGATSAYPAGAPLKFEEPDNAATESFWSTLKTEFYNRRDWPTKAEARLAVGRWIEERFNRRRRHSSINMMTPVQFEHHHLNQTAILAA